MSCLDNLKKAAHPCIILKKLFFFFSFIFRFFFFFFSSISWSDAMANFSSRDYRYKGLLIFKEIEIFSFKYSFFN